MRYYFLLLITSLFWSANAQNYSNLFQNEMFTKESKSLGFKLSKEVKSMTLKYDSETKTYEFDRLGRVIRTVEHDKVRDYIIEYKFTQNEAGETVCTNHAPGFALFIWTYNKYGLLTTQCYRNSDDSEGRLLYKNTYDSKGRIVTRESNEYDYETKDTIIYEPDGFIVKNANKGSSSTKYSKYGGRKVYTDYGNGTRDSFCVIEEYGNNLLKSELELYPNGDTLCFREYDKKGNLILKEEKQYVKNVNTLVSTKFVYDKNNRLVEIICHHDGKETERRKYVYNYKGDKKGRNNDTNAKTIYLETDKYGNPLNYYINCLSNDVEVIKREYTYFE